MQTKSDRNLRNDINAPSKIKHLAKINLDLDSPRMKVALENLGFEKYEVKNK